MKIFFAAILSLLFGVEMLGQSDILYFKCGTKFGERGGAIKGCMEAAQANSQGYSVEYIQQHCTCTIELLVSLFTYEEFVKYRNLYGDDVIVQLSQNNINQIRDQYLKCIEDVLYKEDFASSLANLSRADAIEICLAESKNNPYFKDKDAQIYCPCMVDYVRKHGIKTGDLKDLDGQIYRNIEKECE